MNMALIQPCIEKIFINLNAPAAFNLRQKILGDQNANLSYIINETKANVTLRGRGSGFIEATGSESSEPLHLYLEHPNFKNLVEAKNYARNLLETLQTDLQLFMQTNAVTQVISLQQPPPMPIQSTANNQSITIPSAVLSVPPPNIQNNVIQPTHIIQQPNFIPQSQIIPQPMQIIQQTPINIPPPGIPVRTATTPISLQFQGQPANIQIQPATGQQILVNQTPAQQYQLQYIPTTNPIVSTPQAQTIQHFIQPQQVQSIIQPNGQQFITVQGNTAAFMIPPPNFIQNPQNIGTVFNAPPIALNPDEGKGDLAKVKQEQEQKNANMQQMAARTIVANVNQPPPPPIQQFIVNTSPWPQSQQIQQMPLNSQIQIVAQPQAIRNGNEIVIQNPIQTAQGQQVITTYNPQQGPPIQQIQFSNQPIITQPPPNTQIHSPALQMQNIQANIEQQQPQQRANPLSYQQQFEQKISASNMTESQQRAMKRKIDEAEADSNKSFPKSGMGSMNKSRPPPPISSGMNQQMNKMNTRPMLKAHVNTSSASTSGDNISLINSKNNSTKSVTAKVNVSQADSKTQMPGANKNENEYVEISQSQQFEIQTQPYMSQPPPGYQSMQPIQQFNQQRGQMIMYQNQPPPPPVQAPQQDMNNFQNANFSVTAPQQSNNRFSAPRMMIPMSNNIVSDASNMIPGSSGSSNFQQPRFRQQW